MAEIHETKGEQKMMLLKKIDMSQVRKDYSVGPEKPVRIWGKGYGKIESAHQ